MGKAIKSIQRKTMITLLIRIFNPTNEMNIVYEECEIFAYFPSFVKAKKCAEILTNTTNGEVQANDNADYDEILHWKKNLFKVPSGKSAKNLIIKSDYQNIALKVFMILPALLQSLQKLVRLKIIVTN